MKTLLICILLVTPIFSFADEFQSIEKLIQTKNYKLAFKDLYQLASIGNASAESKLGDFYIYGLGTPINHKEATYWHLRAANNGSSHSQYVISDFYSNGIFVERSDQEAFKWAFKAAHSGNCNAMSNLSLMYSNGVGAEYDFEKSYYWILMTKSNCPNIDYTHQLSKLLNGKYLNEFQIHVINEQQKNGVKND